MVIWSEPAKNDLRSIHDFIAQDSPHYAKKTVQDIHEKAESIDELPNIGKVVRNSITILSVKSHVILGE